jgi:general secretion pathway protein G
MTGREQVESARLLWEKTDRYASSHSALITHHSSRRILRGERGFTFIEIMVVVAILAILAALVVPRIMGRTDDAKRTAAKVQIRNIEGALQLYKLDNGIYPTTEQGLKALVEKPSVGVVPKKWKLGGYIQKLPEDPWGNPYKYFSPSQTPVQNPGQTSSLRGEYDVISLGTDGETGGEGINADINNWNLDKE